MSRKIRSMRGEIIDLDLLKIKQQMASTPKPVDVKEREQFVDKKIRRRVRKQKVVKDDDLDIDPTIVIEDAEVEVDETIESTEDSQATARPVRKKKV